jgi:hypothetical protein
MEQDFQDKLKQIYGKRENNLTPQQILDQISTQDVPFSEFMIDTTLSSPDFTDKLKADGSGKTGRKSNF